jgi:hypothetical protein
MRFTGRVLATLTLVAVLLATPYASAQRVDPETLTVEWKRRTEVWVRPGLEGWVYNPSTYRIGSVRLKVQKLDGANQVVSERHTWVYGHVPAGGRTQFVIPLEPQDSAIYRISVESFVLISQESP